MGWFNKAASMPPKVPLMRVVHHTIQSEVWHFVERHALRYVLAATALWIFVDTAARRQRKLAAATTGMLVSFLTYAYLSPMFHHDHHRSSSAQGSSVGGYDDAGGDYDAAVRADVSLTDVAHVVLAATGALVGAALGCLLPRPLGGMTLGAASALLVVAFLGGSHVTPLGRFVFAGPACAALGGYLSTR